METVLSRETRDNSNDTSKIISSELIALGFSKQIVKVIAPALNETKLFHYEAGDIIYHENTEVKFLKLIRNGRVKLLNYLEQGRKRIVRLHHRASVIGLNGILDKPHAHTAVAIDNVSLFKIPMPLIKNLKDSDPESYCQVLTYWQEYLDMADTWITDFSTGTIPGRVARLVKYLIDNDEFSEQGEVTLLTVEEMADILGVTPESVSRSMATLKRQNILKPLDDTPNRFTCDMTELLRETEQ